jgi:predicted lipid-binding transport protein (Tim44 family)
MKIWTALLAAVLVVGAFDAEAARRLGGGGSVGRQSPNVTQRQATPPATQPGAPSNAAAQKQAAPAAAPAAQPTRRPWGAMLGGLAAGLGLAWLASALGFGEGLAQFLLFGLLALVIMGVVGMVLRARRARAPAARTGGYAYQGAGAAADAPAAPRAYNPEKVGNDASARPWERSSMAFEAGKYGQQQQGGLRIGSGLEGAQNWGVPAGFDVEGFVAAAKRNFITLQDAWDRSDIASLRAMMTDGMLAEIRSQLAEREREAGGGANRTDVVMLEAQLLGIEDLGADYMASVEFSGMIREEPSAGPSPFREVWNMTKPKDGSAGWLVAGVQALQ